MINLTNEIIIKDVKNIKKEFIKSALNVKDFLLNHYNIEENKINISEDPKYSFIYHVNKEKLNNIKIDKKFIKESVKIFGSSTIAITIEALKIEQKYNVYTDTGRNDTKIDVFEWIKEAQDMGVGEIILTSINNEGTGKGFDLTLYEKASAICKISLLAHGGTRNSEDIYKLFINTNIDGVIIASAFHFNYYKELLNKKKISVRGSTNFLVNQDFKNIFFIGIKDLKKYLKSKNISIR